VLVGGRTAWVELTRGPWRPIPPIVPAASGIQGKEIVVAIKRNSGREIGPKPLLLDRARRARLVPVRRAPLYRRAVKPTLFLAVVLSVGGIAAYRLASGTDTTRLIQAAPQWMQNILPQPSAETQSASPTTQPSTVTVPPPSKPPFRVPDFSNPAPPVQPVQVPLESGSISARPVLPTDAWSVLTAPPEAPPPTSAAQSPTTQP